MKLATYKDGSRDGQLVVVSRDLSTAHYASAIASRLQQVLDDWNFLSPQLEDLSATLNGGKARHAFPFEPAKCMAPLPRAYQWADGSAFINHVELVRRARNAEMPASFWTDPLMYQGGSDDFLGPRDDIVAASDDWGIDFEAEVAVITGDIAMGTTPEAAIDGIRLVMLANDVSLRNLIPAELAKGFGFFQSKPATAFSPVAVTPDELGDAWRGGRLHLDLESVWNGKRVGLCDAGEEMTFHFGQLIAHICKTRNCARRLDRRQRHGQQQGLGARLLLHRREAGDRDDRGRQPADAVHAVRRHHPDRDEGRPGPEPVRRDRAEGRADGAAR